MFLQVIGALAQIPWQAPAVHDTMAAITRQAAYRRSLRSTILDRIMRWVMEHLLRLFDGVRAVPGGKYIAISIAVLLVALVIARLVYVAQLREDALMRAHRTHRGRVYSDPWLEAQRAAAEGQYTDAAHALNAAVLERLTRRERLRLHESKTHGDYARELRAVGSSAYGSFREFGRLYERIIYGLGECDASGYAALLERAKPFLSLERAA